MNKRDRKRSKRLRQQQARAQHLTLVKRFFRPLLSPQGLFWSSVSLVLGLVGTYFLFRATVSIEPDTPIATSAAINVPFKVTNDSVLPIYSLIASCEINSLRFSGVGGAYRIGLRSDVVEVHKLGPKESSSIMTHAQQILGQTPGESVTGGDIIVTLQFTTSIIHWRLTVKRRFEGRIAEDGKLRWYHKAEKE